MSIKVIIENTDANRSVEVFHNPDDDWCTLIPPGSKVGCHFNNGQELMIRRHELTQDLTPAPTQVDDEDGMPTSSLPEHNVTADDLKDFIRQE